MLAPLFLNWVVKLSAHSFWLHIHDAPKMKWAPTCEAVVKANKETIETLLNEL